MNSYKKLISNSFIFALGNLGSKLISFILVPIYTYYLSTEQYGTVDLVTTTVQMLLPIVSMSIFDAVLRFVMEKNNSRDEIMTNSLFIMIIGWLCASIVYLILSFFNVFGESIIYLYLILVIQICEQVFAQYTRAVGKVKVFAMNGIILTLATGIFNILFIVHFNFGVNGYFWAMIISNTISVVYLFITSRIYREIDLSKLNKNVIKELLSFSLPIIPNSLMWWLVNASSRYFILFFVGVNANGLFAVASKIPSLISLVNQIFTQAWQLSAIEEFESENKSSFYTNVFAYLSSVLFVSVSIVIVIIKIIFESFFSAEFYTAWYAVPFLLLATVFSSFSSFLGTNYIAAKQTKGVFRTSIYGGIISVVLNSIFIPIFGIIGAGISSMISFYAIFIIRFYDTKQYVDMNINWSLFIKNVFIIFIQIGFLMVSLPKVPELLIEFILFLLLLLTNRELLKPLLKLFKGRKN